MNMTTRCALLNFGVLCRTKLLHHSAITFKNWTRSTTQLHMCSKRFQSSTTQSQDFSLVEKKAKAATQSINKDIFSRSRNKKTIHEFQSRLFLKMFRATIAFQEKHGHLRIPLRYVIPDGEGFPADLIGCKLGNLFSAIRSRAHWMHYPYKAVLVDLGIVPTESKEFRRYTAEDVDIAFQVYKETNGNLDIPLDFIVTDDISHLYKPHLKGAPLGKILEQIKLRRLHFTCIDVRERWRKLGIKFARDEVLHNKESKLNDEEFRKKILARIPSTEILPAPSSTKSKEGGEASDRNLRNFNQFVEAFLQYKEIFGNSDVPQVYSIRKEDGFADHLVGYKLGRKLNYITSSASWMRGTYKDKLIELGIVPPESEEHRRKYSATDIERSLRVYLERYQNLNIPREYVIAQNFVDEPTFPPNMIGAPLGQLLELIKTRRLYFNPTDVANRWRKLSINFEKRKPSSMKP